MRYYFSRLNRFCLGLLLLLLLIAGSLRAAALVPAPVAGPAWDNPTTMSLRSLGTSASTGEAHLAFEDNLDCIKSTYRLNGSDTKQAGCYEPTAFGGLDVEHNLVSFNDNEETAVPLLGYGPHDVLLAWPGTASALSITPTPTDGVYLSIYKDILTATTDQRNLLGQVTAKQVNRAADVALLDPAGRKLIVNFNSLAFSDGGSWLVAESLSGLFYRINVASLTAKPFAPSYTNFGAGYNESQVAVSPDGDYVAIANTAARSLRVYNLANCLSTSSDTTICPSHDYWPFIASKASSFTHPLHLRFLNDGLLALTDISATSQTTYELAPVNNSFALMDYLALGDSYTAGEGAFAYKQGTDTPTNQCHNSLKSYPSLLTTALFTQAGGKSIACSGARMADITGGPDYNGQADDGLAYGQRTKDQITQLLTDLTPGTLPQSAFAGHYQPAAMTVSVGGNDIGFGSILKLCVAPHVNPHVTNANACYSTYEDRLELANSIDAQVPRLVKMLKQLKQTTPGTVIYLVGYPLIAVDTGSCAINVHLNTTELALSIEVIKELNHALARAAIATGSNYVDVEMALAGHRLCETDSKLVAVNGVTAGNDGGFAASIFGHSVTVDFLGKESYHPTAYGQQLIEEAILRQTHNLHDKLAAPLASAPASTATAKILDAPKSGRPTIRKVPTVITKHQSAKRGASLPITVSGRAHGLRANTTYTVKLKQGSAVTSIGTILSATDSAIAGSVNLPSTTVPGTYELDLDGTDQLGSPVSMIDVITIIDSDTDYDGDTTPDTVDGCPTIKNSGIDSDHDGIDDACDGIIDDSPPDTSLLPAVVVAPAPAAGGSTGLGNAPLVAATDVLATLQPATASAPSTSLQAGIKTKLLSVSSSPAPKPLPLQTSSPAGVLGATVTARPQSLQPVAARLRPAAATPRPVLPRLPWFWLVVAYALALVILTLTKRARHSLGSSWRRKRDSNPRYP
ncbi:MAG: SGNH/GDSL hydrolase family protein [Patescibacteria group bacterium]|nr:SGNH/GDSL hydrolase family protein [Patescibacteria group bacterium]